MRCQMIPCPILQIFLVALLDSRSVRDYPPSMNSPTDSAASPSKSLIRFTPMGLSVLCVSLVAAAALLGRWSGASASGASAANNVAKNSEDKSAPKPAMPWGELIIQDIDIEQPDEYVSFEVTTDRKTRWTFNGIGLERVRALLQESGLSGSLIDDSLQPERAQVSASGVIVQPTDEAVMGLSSSGREKLYSYLAQWPENRYMANAYHFVPSRLDALLATGGISAKAREQVNKLVYERAGHFYFSDPEIVLRGLPDAAERQRLLRVLTSQRAVLARLKVDQNSNIDAILGYWGNMPGVNRKDLRPLLESLHREPEGGSISLLYLLPEFARERLYTFPYPNEEDEIASDCHWTALNFFNDTPDERLRDNAFASNHIKENYYPIGKPSSCGDLVFITNPAGEVIHSAVYIADDICFTKNGVNFAQPWILMRMTDLSDVYTVAGEPKMLFYRRKQI